MTTVTQVPHRMECFGQTGWTVTTFATARDAAAFVSSNGAAATPCWKRFDIVNGELVLAR